MFEQLTQWLGSTERATYATWLLMAIGGLIALYLLISVIRALMRGRINMSRSDRRGRAPRLGITDFFDIDKDGRRLVIVRRDNVEHLIMIGGPHNDMLIESSIVRTPRPDALGNGDGQARPTITMRAPEAIEPPVAAAAQIVAPPVAATVPPKPVAPVPVPAQPPRAVQAAAPPAPAVAPQSPPARPAVALVPPQPAPPAEMPKLSPALEPAPASPAAMPPPPVMPQTMTPAPVRPAASNALNAVTERLNANLKTIVPAGKISPKPSSPLVPTLIEGGAGDLEQEMARLLGKSSGGP
jgi:flagellar protein FliO/FliZ